MEHAFLLIFIVTGVSSCSIKVCLHWTVEGNTLKLTCRTDNLSLFVNFNDNHGQEIAHCTIPIPAPLCHDTNENTTTVQYPDQNVTIVKVNGIIDQRINGNWSCLHGVDDDVVEIYIKTSKDSCNDSKIPDSCNDSKIPKTELVIIAVGGFVILVVLNFFCIFRRKCKNTCGVNSSPTGAINASENPCSGANIYEQTPPRGTNINEPTTCRGERGARNGEPTTSRGENMDKPTTSREPLNDKPTTSRGPSNGINNKDKPTNKDIELTPFLEDVECTRTENAEEESCL